jgi:hypothetical protein
MLWRFLFTVLAAGVLLPFQNCGKGYKSADFDLNSFSSSSQCRVAAKAEALQKLQVTRAPVNCSDFNQYACERRIFAPGIQNLSHSLKQCTADGSICVDVDVFEYNTDVARAIASSASFAPGGEYNRQEVRCRHRFSYKGVAVFEGAGDSLEQALAGALDACEKGSRL